MSKPLYQSISCPFCDGGDLAIFAQGTELATFRFYKKLDGFHNLNYVICRDCKLVFANPRLDYNDRTLNDLFPTHVSGQEQQIDPAQTHKRQRAQTTVANATEWLGDRRGRFQEIGCGFGHALQAASELGFEATGTELYDDFIERGRSRNLDVRPGSVDRIEFDTGTVDVLYLEDVLEHLKYPFTYLDEAARVIKSGGILFIHTWAIGTPGTVYDAFGPDWRTNYNLDLTAHTVIFPRPLLRDALTDRGFEIKRADLIGELDDPPASSRADRHIQFWDFYCRKTAGAADRD